MTDMIIQCIGAVVAVVGFGIGGQVWMEVSAGWFIWLPIRLWIRLC